jgi:hypothetical protein
MATIAERILEAIRYTALDDDVLAKRLGVVQRQSINQAARRLEAQGSLRRYIGPDGKIVNALIDASTCRVRVVDAARHVGRLPHRR